VFEPKLGLAQAIGTESSDETKRDEAAGIDGLLLNVMCRSACQGSDGVAGIAAITPCMPTPHRSSDIARGAKYSVEFYPLVLSIVLYTVMMLGVNRG
jgi:hypothetical protein